MDKRSSAVFTARDLDEAKAQGVVAGEVRILKWGAGVAIAAILGALGLLYQNQTALHENVARVEQRVVAVEERVGKVEDRLKVEDRGWKSAWREWRNRSSWSTGSSPRFHRNWPP